MENLLVALVARVPDLSDAAKVTLLEILVHKQAGTRRIPSLKELSRIRGKTTVSIQSHLKELQASGVIELVRPNPGGKRKVHFNLDVLARSLGFSSRKAIDFDSFLEAFHAVEVSRAKSSVRGSRIASKPVSSWKPLDQLAYFDIKYGEIDNRTRRGASSDVNIFRLMQKEYGPRKLRRMVEYFARNWKRMRMKAFKPAQLYDNRNRIAEMVGNE